VELRIDGNIVECEWNGVVSAMLNLRISEGGVLKRYYFNLNQTKAAFFVTGVYEQLLKFILSF
jgi:hypothetical protein